MHGHFATSNHNYTCSWISLNHFNLTIMHKYNYMSKLVAQITLLVEIEKLKRTILLFCCCNWHKAMGKDHQDNNTGVDSTLPCATKSVGLSHVTVTPHSRLKTLGYLVGVDGIDALISDFEQHSVGEVFHVNFYIHNLMLYSVAIPNCLLVFTNLSSLTFRIRISSDNMRAQDLHT